MTLLLVQGTIIDLVMDEECTVTQTRMTKQRQLVLDAARTRHDHPTADQIYLETRKADPRISRGTVYRNLEQLSNAGALLHVKVPGADRYDCRLDRHYHFVCTGCGAVYDVPMAYQDAVDKQVMEQTGFSVERHRMIFEGLCPVCRKMQGAKAAK